MISIPIAIPNKENADAGPNIWYITSMSSSEFSSMLQTTETYTTILREINLTLTTVSPSDITITDIQNFKIGPNTIDMQTSKGWSDVSGLQSGNAKIYLDGPDGRKLSRNGAYYYTVTSYKDNRFWTVRFPSYSGSDLQSIGGLLKRLMECAHSHIKADSTIDVRKTASGSTSAPSTKNESPSLSCEYNNNWAPCMQTICGWWWCSFWRRGCPNPSAPI